MGKLLSDEELQKAVWVSLASQMTHAINCTDLKHKMQNSCVDFTEKNFDQLIELINTQKRLYAESIEREARIDELRNTVLRDGEIYFHVRDGKLIPIQERFNQLKAESED